jgi:hypothetical protein
MLIEKMIEYAYSHTGHGRASLEQYKKELFQ